MASWVPHSFWGAWYEGAGVYVHAVMGGGHDIDARVSQPRSSEVFTLEWVDKARDQARFRTREGYSIHAVTGGGGEVDARVQGHGVPRCSG